MKKYLLLILYLFIASLNYNLILKPLKLVAGGTQGLSLIITSIINLKDAYIIFIINIITLILSLLLLSKSNTKSILVSTFLYPLFVKITSNIYLFKINNIIIFSIIGGIICGITGGLIYKLGFSSGGVSTINVIVNKYLNIKVSLSNFIINIIIIILGMFKFGIVKGIYSIIVILVSSLCIDIILKNN